MRKLYLHVPIYLLLIVITFAAFWRLMTTPFWNPLDFLIIHEAHVLSQDPLAMFGHLGTYFSQPLLQLAFLLEYRAFGLAPGGYIGVNLLVHATNTFVVYMLVNMLFPRERIALIAAILFALTVGSYGKVLTSVSQLESLLLAFFHLLVLYLFIRNDFRDEGRLKSPYFLMGLAVFVLSGLTKASTFSLLGCLLAYNIFFHSRRGGRPIVSKNLLIFVSVGILFYLAQSKWGYRQPTVIDPASDPLNFTLLSFKNIFRYLNLMFFPMQNSPILKEADAWVIWVYNWRTVIRLSLTLAILSYSFFGFVFGGSAVRFFIAWTYITLLPFTGLSASGGWLNLNHLYLTSLGFCVILAAGTRGTSRLLERRRWRRYIPYLVPVYFVVLALVLTFKLDTQHRRIAATDQIRQMHGELVDCCGR